MAAPTSPPRRRRIWWRVLLVLLVSGLALEAGLRLLLFHSAPGGRFDALRQAHLFADRDSLEYFELKHVLSDPEKRRPTRHDAQLGWTHQRFEATTYDHQNRARLAGRRPVLFYGDSFAACVTQPADCWQGLLEASPLGRELCLMNYGVGGYGFDQTCLLVHATLDLWQASAPIVVVSLLVDADLDRAALPFFSWPKPDWIVDADGHAQVDGPVPDGNDAWIGEHGIAIQSYLWRWLLHGSGLLPDGWVARLSGQAAHEERVRALTRSLLDQLQADLDARGLEWFVLVFHGMKHFRADPEADPEGEAQGPAEDWREPFFLHELDTRGIRYVSSRGELAAALEDPRREVFDYFVRQGPSKRHYTALGNQVVFQALRRGLEGGADGPNSAR